MERCLNIQTIWIRFRRCGIKFERNSSKIRCYVGVREILFAYINMNTLLDNHRERYRKFLQVTFRHDLALDAVTMTIHYACAPRGCSTRMIRKWQWFYKLLYATSTSLLHSKQFFIGRLDVLQRIVQIPKDASLEIHEISWCFWRNSRGNLITRNLQEPPN